MSSQKHPLMYSPSHTTMPKTVSPTSSGKGTRSQPQQPVLEISQQQAFVKRDCCCLFGLALFVGRSFRLPEPLFGECPRPCLSYPAGNHMLPRGCIPRQHCKKCGHKRGEAHACWGRSTHLRYGLEAEPKQFRNHRTLDR